jgi:hypothetical protein
MVTIEMIYLYHIFMIFSDRLLFWKKCFVCDLEDFDFPHLEMLRTREDDFHERGIRFPVYFFEYRSLSRVAMIPLILPLGLQDHGFESG